MRSKICLAALAASFAAASPAYAQLASAPAEARGVVLLPLTLTKTQDLDFGTVVASPVAGNVVIDADSGLRSVGGGVTAVPSFPGDRALFQGAGSAGQDVDLTLNAPAVLTSGPNLITVTSMTFDNCAGPGACTTSTRTIDGTGAFAVGVGGDFAIGANQANGLYTANFTVTADYK
jgi:hypothetical protein